MVGFEYQETGLLVGGRWHPIVKMDWIEGDPLNRFVAEHLEDRGTLRQLQQLWVKLARRLEAAEVAHADLQHGNVLLVPPAREGEGPRLRLVDYDGIHVPALAARPSGELGHRAYQHPQRLREGIYSAAVDRFSHLAIYCAIHCLLAGGRGLWDRYDNQDNLLFREPDFTAPGESELFQRLWAVKDEDLRALVGHLILATQQPLDQVPLLDEIMSDGQVRPLETKQEQELFRLMGDRPSARGPQQVRQHPPVAEAVSPAAQRDLRVEGATDVLKNLVRKWLHLPTTTLPTITNSTITNSIGMKLALIPAGEFLMGCPDSDRSGVASEQPQHRVRITRSFYFGVYEVTQGEYQRVLGSNPSRFKGDARLPVETVSWQDAMTFCERLSALPAERSAGRVYRLPTEAEWEYACRAGSATIYSFGDSEWSLGKYAWYDSNSGRKTHPVGQKRPNAWGLYDMHGNVWEWCSDWYDVSYYASSPEDDPTGSVKAISRVLRGGSWLNFGRFCRSAFRYWFVPVRRNGVYGFRVAQGQSSE
jgi:formylglycine-generating enzyme required for sulfatase activity